MSVVYTTVLGQVLMENRGGIVTEFVPDPLGSVVKHKDSTGAYVHSAEYWPYGEIQSSTGNLPGPFAYCGTWGYYRDNASMTYVRARYYRPVQGRWLTVDPFWPKTKAYLYAGNFPTRAYDPTGRFCQVKDNECSKLGTSPKAICIALLCSIAAGSDIVGGPKGILDIIDNIGGREWKQIIIGIGKGDLQPNPSPEECCKEANKGTGSDLVSRGIGLLCEKQAKDEVPCFAMMKTKKGCDRCCDVRYMEHSRQWNICRFNCTDRWGE